MMGLLKKIYDRYFPGSTLAHKLFWKYRFAFGKVTIGGKDINNSLDHPHRQELLVELREFSGVKKVLELGSSWGPNLMLIKKTYPEISCVGIDISQHMVKKGNSIFAAHNLKDIELLYGDMTSLSEINDNEFDLIVSDAALIYVDNKNITKYAKEMARIAGKGLILIEFDSDNNDQLGSIYNATWTRDYETLFKKYADRIIKRRISESTWPGKWSAYGKIITIFLNQKQNRNEKTFNNN